jgi:hypothetical protein
MNGCSNGSVFSFVQQQLPLRASRQVAFICHVATAAAAVL